MTSRSIGKSGIQVKPLCLGSNVFGWNIDEARSFEVLDAFVAGGGDFIDTADVYSAWKPGNQGGESEAIIGSWMKSRNARAKVVIATKVGFKMGHGGEGLSAAYIKRAVEDSLTRLQTDVIDLYQSHTDDEKTPLEETLRAYDDLVKAGKVRAIGASNYNGARLREAADISARHKLPAYVCLQPNYNYIDRSDYEDNLRPTVLAQGIGVIPYFSLAKGFLSGKYQPGQALPDSARAGGIEKSYFNDAGWAALKRVEHAARELNATPAQIALAWLMAQPDITAPIASATTVAQTEELLGALRLDAARVASLL
jgi:aryl-alcohol dehydrogenase-like predicted oxidoreductase